MSICRDCDKRTVCQFVNKVKEIEGKLPKREMGTPLFPTIYCEEKVVKPLAPCLIKARRKG